MCRVTLPQRLAADALQDTQREQGSPATQSRWRHRTSEDLLLRAACMWVRPSPLLLPRESLTLRQPPPGRRAAWRGGNMSKTKPVPQLVPEGRLPPPPTAFLVAERLTSSTDLSSLSRSYSHGKFSYWQSASDSCWLQTFLGGK